MLAEPSVVPESDLDRDRRCEPKGGREGRPEEHHDGVETMPDGHLPLVPSRSENRPPDGQADPDEHEGDADGDRRRPQVVDLRSGKRNHSPGGGNPTDAVCPWYTSLSCWHE